MSGNFFLVKISKQTRLVAIG